MFDIYIFKFYSTSNNVVRYPYSASSFIIFCILNLNYKQRNAKIYFNYWSNGINLSPCWRVNKYEHSMASYLKIKLRTENSCMHLDISERKTIQVTWVHRFPSPEFLQLQHTYWTIPQPRNSKLFYWYLKKKYGSVLVCFRHYRKIYVYIFNFCLIISTTLIHGRDFIQPAILIAQMIYFVKFIQPRHYNMYWYAQRWMQGSAKILC